MMFVEWLNIAKLLFAIIGWVVLGMVFVFRDHYSQTKKWTLFTVAWLFMIPVVLPTIIKVTSFAFNTIDY